MAGTLISGANLATINRSFSTTVSLINSITQSTVNATSALSTYTSKASGLSGTFKGLNSIVGQLDAKLKQAFSVANLQRFASECLEIGSALSEVQNVVDVTFGSMSEKVNEMSEAMADTAGMSETMAKNMMGVYGAMAKAYGMTTEEAYKMSEALTQLTGDVASFYNKDMNVAFTKMKSIFTGETEPLKEFGIIMTQAALNEYALSQGINKTVQQMSSKEKLLLRNMYVTEKLAAVSGDFVRTQNGWANQTRILELRWESFKSSIGQGLINLLTPAIQMLNQLALYTQKAADSFKDFTKTLTGVENNEDAGGSAIAAAYSEAADAINETQTALKRTTTSIDEIHKINGDNTSAESVLGLNLDDIAKQTEKAKEEGKNYANVIDEIIADIKSSWEKADFSDMGAKLGEHINKAMTKINDVLPEIWEIAKRFGASLASGINGILSATDWEVVGENIIGLLKIKLYAIRSFLETFDFKTLGKSFADGLRGIFAEGEDGLTFLDLIADNLAMALNGISNTILTFFENTDFSELGGKFNTAFNRFLENFDAEKVGNIVRDAFIGMGDFITNALTPETFNKIGSKIGDLLKGALDPNGAGKSIFDSVVELVGSGIEGSFALLGGFFSTDGLLTAIINGLAYSGQKAELWLFEKLGSSGAKISAWFGTALKDYIANGIDVALIPFKKLGENVEGFWLTLAALGNEANEWIYGALTDYVNNGIATLGDFIMWVEDSASTMWDNVTGFFSDGWENIKEVFANVGDFFEEVFNTIQGKFETIGEKIGDAVGGAFQGAINWILEKAVNLINGFITSINNCIGIINDIPGVSIGSISTLDVPQLAQGGYVGANMPQLVVIGDNKREGEIVSPESKIREQTTQAINDYFGSQFISQLAGAIASVINTNTGHVEVKNYIDCDRLSEVIRSEIIMQTVRGGV